MPPQSQRHQLTIEEVSRSWAYWNVGLHSKGCHHLWCEPKCDTQSMESPPDVWISGQCNAGGRQRPTTPTQDRFLVVQARRHPFVNATTLRNELRNAVGVNISTQKVHNRLHHDLG